MAKAKGSRTVSFIVFAALVVCLVLAIVGLAIPQWTTIKINEDYADLVPDEVIEEAESSFGDIVDYVTSDEYKEEMEYLQKMKDTAEEIGLEGDDLDMLNEAIRSMQESAAVVAFGLITVLLLAVAAVICLLNIIFNIGFFRFIVLAAGVLALIAGIITIALTAAMIDMGSFGEAAEDYIKPVVGAGAVLLAVGGILGGLTAGAGFFLGKKK